MKLKSKIQCCIIFIIYDLIILLSFFLTLFISNQFNDILKEKHELEEKITELEDSLVQAEFKTIALINEYNYEVETYFSNTNDIIDIIEPFRETNTLEWFKIYKDLVMDLDPPETIYDYYSNEEINMLCKCIETEVYDQPFINKVYVASVLLNRIDSDSFNDEPIKVVTSPNQFAYGRSIITEDTILALEYAFMFDVEKVSDCIGFHSNKTAYKEWNGWEYVFTDEVGHHFYKMKGD